MIKSKVFDILRTLSKDELKRFADFVESPFFNKKKAVIELLHSYRNFHPDFDNEQLTKEKIFEKIFPGKKYNDEVFRNLNSDLLKLLEDFIGYLDFLKEPFNLKRYVLWALNERQIFSLFNKNFDDSRKALERSMNRDINFFMNYFYLYDVKQVYDTLIRDHTKDDILEVEKFLTCFYILKIFSIHCFILHHKVILPEWDFKSEKDFFISYKVINDLYEELPAGIKDLPQIQIFYNALMLESTDELKFFYSLKSKIGEFGNLIDKRYLHAMYSIMIGYVQRTKSIRKAEALFEILNMMLENDVMKCQNHFPDTLFFLHVKVGAILKKFDWTENFIKKYSSMLLDNLKEGITELSYAFLYFEKKELERALLHLSKVKHEDTGYYFEVKQLNAKILFELDEFELLVNNNSAYGVYIANTKNLSKLEFEKHSSFLTCLNKLIRIKEQENYDKLIILKEYLSHNNVIDVLWFEEKIKELEYLAFQK